MRITLLFILIALYALLPAQTAREVALRSMNSVETGDMEMTSTIRIRDGRGNERVRQISTASRTFGEVTKMLTVFLHPPDVKGTSLLVYDYENKEDNMWIFLPALRRVRRIVSTEKGNNFMGSEFSNADMSKPNIDDFNYTDLGTETKDGKNFRKIEAKPKTAALAKELNFSRKITFIDPGNFLSHRVEFYDASGKLHRVQRISDYRRLSNGKFFAQQMVMENVQNGRSTLLQVDQFQLGSQLPESRFSPNALEQ